MTSLQDYRDEGFREGHKEGFLEGHDYGYNKAIRQTKKKIEDEILLLKTRREPPNPFSAIAALQRISELLKEV